MEITKEIAGVIVKRFEFLEGSKFDVISAIASDFENFEDAIDYFSCVNSEIDLIVTNEKKFLNHYKPPSAYFYAGSSIGDP